MIGFSLKSRRKQEAVDASFTAPILFSPECAEHTTLLLVRGGKRMKGTRLSGNHQFGDEQGMRKAEAGY
jgi:hypothetical protein